MDGKEVDFILVEGGLVDKIDKLLNQEKIRTYLHVYDEAISTCERNIIIFATAILMRVLREEGYLEKPRYGGGAGEKLSKLLVRWRYHPLNEGHRKQECEE